jgi:hypothetical protein
LICSYFLFEFICPPASLRDLQEEYSRDVDIVRRRIFRLETPEEFECTLHEEMQPPAYRYLPTLRSNFMSFSNIHSRATPLILFRI